MMSLIGKCKTFRDYVYTGWHLGSDLRSKLLLASMLPRLKLRGGVGRSFRVRVRVGHLKCDLFLREEDIFIVHEVLTQNPYIHPEMKENPPRCILDLGANIGLATIRFKAEFTDAEVHSYEPDPENFELLRLNTERLPDMFLYREAVGSREGEAILYVAEGRHSASSLRYSSQSKRVREVACQVKTLDQILSSIWQPVDLIKFDIEGVEYEVFAASRMVHEVPWIVGEIKGSQSDMDRFVALFPKHSPEVRWCGSKIAYVYLRKRVEC